MSASDSELLEPRGGSAPTDEWIQDCEGAGTRVEVRPALGGDVAAEGWTEIPTTEVELYETKAENVDIKRSAKVQYPMDWGGRSVQSLLDSYKPTDEEDAQLMHARIWLEQPDGGYVLKHLGWVGGVGASGEATVGKFWVYDFAELLDGIPFGAAYNNPTLERAFQIIVDEIGERTAGAIPLNGATIAGPDEAADDVISTGTSLPTTAVRFTGGKPRSVTLTVGSKSFQRNHDTVLDGLQWISKKSNASFYYRPTTNGVVLVVDIEESRGQYVQDEALAEAAESFEGRVDELEQAAETFFGVDVDVSSALEESIDGTVTVRENTALYELVPQNTVHVRGEPGGGIVRDIGDVPGLKQVGEAVGLIKTPQEEEFPVAKATAVPLKQAAGGETLAPPVVDSDATSIEQAESEATAKLKEITSKPSEGHIILDGAPTMSPWDTLTAYETCGDFVETQPVPVTYEVAEVKHTKKAGEALRTRLRVSILVRDSQIRVESKSVPMAGPDKD